MNSHHERAGMSTRNYSGTSFSLKDRWIEETRGLPDELEGKPRDVALSAVRKSFEEFREEAKKEVRTGDAGTMMFRLLDQVRQFIRFYELAEEQVKNIPAGMGLSGEVDPETGERSAQGSSVIPPGIRKWGAGVMNTVGAFRDPGGKRPAESAGNYPESSSTAGIRNDFAVGTPGYLLSFTREQLEMLTRNIGDFLGVIDDVLPKLLSEPVLKSDLPLDGLETFQGLLAIMLETDDRKFTEAMRSQEDVIGSLIGRYGLSVVFYEEESDPDRRNAWFDERRVNPTICSTIRTVLPALVRDDAVVCRGTVYVPRPFSANSPEDRGS